ncbi:methyl-accepting chemotaxis protein [Parashewanella tropica]|uniref:methyl-accepting chemotaxis protein n=1 Tax=Parashewanella tropica TaxID=2547970 RepID=UPI00105924DB|nr:methyl-accepting chemotaxis protein [Parashewanella tropica]
MVEKNLGFKKALTLSMLILISVILLIADWLFYQDIRDKTINEVNHASKLILKSEANKIETWFSSQVVALNGLAASYSTRLSDTQLLALAKNVKAATNVDNVVINRNDGLTVSSDNVTPSEMDWVSLAKQTSGIGISSLSNTQARDKNTITLYKAVNNGAIAVNASAQILNRAVKEINYTGAVTVVTDENGLVLASTSQVAGKGRYLKEFGLGNVVNKMVVNDETLQNYVLKGIDKLAFTKAIPLVNGKKWYLFIGVNKSIAYQSINELRTKYLLFALGLLIAACLLIVIVLNQLFKPIYRLKTMVVDLSKGNGDLTQRLEVRSQDDLGQISIGINQFIEQLQEMMLEVLNTSKHIGESIERLKLESDANRKILISHSKETEQVVAAIEEMSSTASDVAQNGSQTAIFTKDTSHQVVDSKEQVVHATTTVAKLVESVEMTAENITEIDRDTTDITNVLKVIGDIADQTNLLALNAAIEAARAGEQGRGFAVVADEVRALAARTQTSTAEIEQTISKLRQGSSAAINAMNETKVTCEQTALATDKVAVDLDEIVNSVTQINDLNTQIATAATQQSSVADEISCNMSAICQMANELSSSSEANVKQTESLSKANQGLIDIVNKFKLTN